MNFTILILNCYTGCLWFIFVSSYAIVAIGEIVAKFGLVGNVVPHYYITDRAIFETVSIIFEHPESLSR